MNLSTAQASRRAKEVGIKKVGRFHKRYAYNTIPVRIIYTFIYFT